MTRKIKFRAKVMHHDPMTNPSNGWVEGYYFQDLTQGEMCSYIIQAPYTYEVIPETVGQFTGFLDKNGKEIYEGDIIEIKEIGGYGCKRKGVTEYDVEECAFVVKLLPPSWADTVRVSTRVQFCVDMNCTHEYYNQYTVIGNIHDKEGGAE